MRRAIYRTSDSKRLDNIQLPDDHEQDGSLFSERQQLWFYQDEGGLRATDDNNNAMDTIYYLGVIDILTPYGMFKKVEHVYKGLKADIVCVLFSSSAHTNDG
jgi:1-phosphatidylinositol-4-phosphate 5-kinase